MTLQERLRDLYTQHGTNYVQAAADRIDDDEALMREALKALTKGESALRFAMIEKLSKRLEKAE